MKGGEAGMKTLEFSDREMTYLLLALRKYEEKLQTRDDDEPMGDDLQDLIIIQALRKKIAAAKG